MNNLQTLQTLFAALPDWEREAFLSNNAEQLLADLASPTAKLNLDDVETEDIVDRMIENGMLTWEELLDTVVENVDEFREILVEAADYEYENQEESFDDDEYYNTYDGSHTTYEPGEDDPF